jgi:hypothetical protein
MSARKLTLTVVVSLCALAGGLCALSAAPALAARGHAFGFKFGEPCVSEPCGNGQLKEPSGVAVNEATGRVYVIDTGDERIERFSAAGAYEAQFNGAETPAKAFVFAFGASNGIAVDNSCYFKGLTGEACEKADPSNGDVYVVDQTHKVVDKFSAEGVYLGQLQEASGGAPFPFLQPEDAGVDAKGTVWVTFGNPGSGEPAHVGAFSNSAQSAFISELSLPFFAGSENTGFAVDSKDDFYVDQDNFAPRGVSKFDSSGEFLLKPFFKEEVTEEAASAVAVDLASGEVFLDSGGSVGAFSPGGQLEEQLGSGELVSGSGVAVSHAHETLYVADKSADVVDVFPPEPPSKPTVTEALGNVTGDSATLGAEVNPRGASTEYHFEYGVCASLAACAGSSYEASAPVPDGFAGVGFEADRVTFNVQGLRAGTVYHYRVVAENEFGKALGEEGTFTTQTAESGSTLPDGRMWEMVSPPDKHGALIEPINERGLLQAAADGGAFTFFTTTPTEEEPRGYAIAAQVFATRGADGWSSRDISPPHETATGPSVGQGFDYRFFSEDLSRGLIEPLGEFTPLSGEETSPVATERTPYVREDFTCGVSPATCYTPLVTAADVPAGVSFGGNPEALRGAVPFVGASPDLSHVILSSNVALTGDKEAEGKMELYEWSADGPPGKQLQLVSPGVPEAELGFQNTNARGAVSADGSRVFFSPSSEGGRVYMRDLAHGEAGETVAIGNPGAVFQIASANGSRVFYSEGTSLSVCEIGEGPGGKLECQSSTLGSFTLFGSVIGASEDGSYVYYVSAGNELVMDHYSGGEWKRTSIAQLSPHDGNDSTPVLSHLTGRVSPNGEWVAFMSQRSLTGYDNRDAVSGHSDEEVYLYGARAGRLVCASCNPTGARPVGVEYEQINGGLVGGDRVWEGSTWIAANVPGWTPYSGSRSLHQSRYLSNEGRLFFNSSDALVPQDVDGAEDVYEYEPPGVGGCTVSSVAFDERSGGCVGLISSGTSSEESAFADASASGGDVFFLTSARLVAQDYDTSVDVYDAHECTAVSPCFAVPPASPPPCGTGDACKPAPSPQPSIFGAPASATFSGAGNVVPSAPVATGRSLTRSQKLARALTACKKESGRGRRAACERKARRRYGASASRKANVSRGRGR